MNIVGNSFFNKNNNNLIINYLFILNYNILNFKVFNKLILSPILYCCCHIGCHPQGNLAMFGYGPAMKVEIYSNPFYIQPTCLNHV